MPTLLAFKEEGGLETLHAMLNAFTHAIVQDQSRNSDETSKPKVAAFGLKKILDLYFILVNGKYISETGSHFNLQRHVDRAHSTGVIYQQIVVEFRAAILPSALTLWDSEVVEKVPEPTVKRLLDVLKLITSADQEPTPAPNDRVSRTASH